MKIHIQALVCVLLTAVPSASAEAGSAASSIVDLSKDFEVDDAAVKSSPGSQAIMELCKNLPGIRTIMVLEDGKVVAKYIRDDVDENKPFDVMSVTKSWTSLLIGMIIEEGKLSLDTTLGSIFPDESAWELSDEVDFRKSITIEEMLSMRSGLQTGSGSDALLPQTLANPLIDKTKSFNYLSTNMIMSYVIFEVTGLTPLQYLAQNVLPKLGINESEFLWDLYAPNPNPNGLENPYAGMELTPAQMAKFGQLYLQGGKASPLDNNPPIVSKEWVDASWTASSKNIFPGLNPSFGLTLDDLEAHVGMKVGQDHGYLFYNHRPQLDNALWCADGSEGQHICVSPSLSRVVVQQRDGLPNDELIAAQMAGDPFDDLLLDQIADTVYGMTEVIPTAMDSDLSFKADAETETTTLTEADDTASSSATTMKVLYNAIVCGLVAALA